MKEKAKKEKNSLSEKNQENDNVIHVVMIHKTLQKRLRRGNRNTIQYIKCVHVYIHLHLYSLFIHHRAEKERKEKERLERERKEEEQRLEEEKAKGKRGGGHRNAPKAAPADHTKPSPAHVSGSRPESAIAGAPPPPLGGQPGMSTASIVSSNTDSQGGR